MDLTSKLPALGLTIFSEMTQLANDETLAEAAYKLCEV